ncbi:ABC transporter permease [Echinicola shivajiensis]|uniref:ABC transporter permease n=1 Tax=Echinicola shivajiensis TaxID=1035916 RepID=UPI001BFCCABE|nr:ABC transporter permease [Echinicola shivajiensis]
MKTLRFLLRKEFKQIFRNPIILRLILVIPIVQLLVLPLAADFEIKNINIAVVDHDRSPYSQKLTSKIIASGYFKLSNFGNSYEEAYEIMEKNEADLILEIPVDFEKNFVREQHEDLFLAINAINGTKASVGGVYLSNIINNFNHEIRQDWLTMSNNSVPQIEIATLNWFNPHMNYKLYMVPGILAFLVTMVGSYMCSLNLVKEKEIGTIEQINVTPIKKYHFILGKLIPFWLIGMFIFSIGLFIVARVVYGIVPAGSILVLYAFLALYLVAVLGVGLLISTYSNSQQQAMSLAFFFIMIFLLMSGLFTPIEGMPVWAKVITKINPVTYFIDVMRMVVMKGSGFSQLKNHFLIMFGFAVFFNSWAIWNYRKTN